MIGNVPLAVCDLIGSSSAESILAEMAVDAYRLNRIDFKYGDVIVDVGAHVGVVSIYLAKRFPFLRIIAFEPTPWNYANLRFNIRLNGVSNVHAHRLAVTADGRDIHMSGDLTATGGTSAVHRKEEGFTPFTAHSISLDRIFEDHGVHRCKLLKIDCEGSEHEVLHSTSVLNRVDYLSGEFHINQFLSQQGYSIDRLITKIAQTVPPDNITVNTVKMWD